MSLKVILNKARKNGTGVPNELIELIRSSDAWVNYFVYLNMEMMAKDKEYTISKNCISMAWNKYVDSQNKLVEELEVYKIEFCLSMVSRIIKEDHKYLQTDWLE